VLESEGLAEKYRAVVKGSDSRTNRSAKGGRGRARNPRAKAFSFAHRSKVDADGAVRKNSDVTSGEPVESADGYRGKRTYKCVTKWRARSHRQSDGLSSTEEVR
jgi:hypothetical protein